MSKPPLPTAGISADPTAGISADPTAGISADIAAQFNRHVAAPHACTTAHLPIPSTSAHVDSGAEVGLGRPTARRISSPRNHRPAGYFGPNQDHLAERAKYGE